MSLRPRYSLLTLLVLTAIVAGGVKLWYGPHHVVERPEPREEDEYTYTRNWRGSKVIAGPRIKRFKSDAGLRDRFEVTYYRAGVQTSWRRSILFKPETKEYCYLWGVVNGDRVDLTSQEEVERDRVFENEIQRLQELGYHYEPSIIPTKTLK